MVRIKAPGQPSQRHTPSPSPSVSTPPSSDNYRTTSFPVVVSTQRVSNQHASEPLQKKRKLNSPPSPDLKTAPSATHSTFSHSTSPSVTMHARKNMKRRKHSASPPSSPRKRSFQEELKSKGLFIKKMAGDGNCLFRAVGILIL